MSASNTSPVTLDILGIGNAIVDVLARSEDGFLAGRGLDKGGMRLVDTAEAEALYGAMGPGVESSGGSVANSSCRRCNRFMAGRRKYKAQAWQFVCCKAGTLNL